MLFVSKNNIATKTIYTINTEHCSRRDLLLYIDILTKALLVDLFSLDVVKNNLALAKKVTLVPILRAGMPLYIAARELLPDSSFSYIHLKRDEKNILNLGQYVSPSAKNSFVILLDAIAGTGQTLDYALNILREHGIHNGAFLGLMCANETALEIDSKYPEWIFFWGATDHKLLSNGFVKPDIADKDIGDLFSNE